MNPHPVHDPPSCLPAACESPIGTMSTPTPPAEPSVDQIMARHRAMVSWFRAEWPRISLRFNTAAWTRVSPYHEACEISIAAVEYAATQLSADAMAPLLREVLDRRRASATFNVISDSDNTIWIMAYRRWQPSMNRAAS